MSRVARRLQEEPRTAGTDLPRAAPGGGPEQRTTRTVWSAGWRVTQSARAAGSCPVDNRVLGRGLAASTRARSWVSGAGRSRSDDA